jgi:hypothetical protein
MGHAAKGVGLDAWVFEAFGEFGLEPPSKRCAWLFPFLPRGGREFELIGRQG